MSTPHPIQSGCNLPSRFMMITMWENFPFLKQAMEAHCRLSIEIDNVWMFLLLLNNYTLFLKTNYNILYMLGLVCNGFNFKTISKIQLQPNPCWILGIMLISLGTKQITYKKIHCWTKLKHFPVHQNYSIYFGSRLWDIIY